MPSLPAIVTCVAFAALTVSSDEPEAVIESGTAEKLTAGAGFGVTVTVTVPEVAPPGPVAVAVYIVVALGLTVWVPPIPGSL